MSGPDSAPHPPPNFDSQLDDLLARRWLPARRAVRIRFASELPDELRRCVRSLRAAAIWRAYTDNGEVFCAVARTREPMQIEVYFLDREARVCSAGGWEGDPATGWRLNLVPDLSTDRKLPREFA